MTEKQLGDPAFDQQHLVRRVVEDLEAQFAGTFGVETIERFVLDPLVKLLPSAKVTTFLPVLAEKFAKERLTALGKVDGSLPSSAPGGLCVHNAGRSQMAAGWLRHLAGDRVTVYSGGSEPVSTINPATVDAMAEVGIFSVVSMPWACRCSSTSADRLRSPARPSGP